MSALSLRAIHISWPLQQIEKAFYKVLARSLRPRSDERLTLPFFYFFRLLYLEHSPIDS